jgi:putative peptidoglycan lipid II flippase
MLKKTLIVTFFNLLGFGLAFIVNVVISAKFGAGYSLDSYIIALLVPNYIVSILSVILSYTFIPIFTQYGISEKEEAWNIANIFLNIIALSLLLLCFLLIIFSDQIVNIISPGFKLEQRLYCSELFRFYTPVILFSALNEVIASIFYSNNRFLAPLVNKVISPLLTIFFVFAFSSSLNVKSIILASLLSAIVQFSILLFQLLRFPEFKLRFKICFNHPGIVKIFRLILPLLMSTIFYKLFPIIDSSILSNFKVGDISRINYANKLQLVIGSIISSVFSVQVFSLFSQLSAHKNWAELKMQASVFIRLLLFCSIPIAMFTFLFSENIIKLIYERGSFSSFDTTAVSLFLNIYILALPSIAIGNIISQLLYAMSEMKSILIIGLFEFAFYVLMCYTLSFFWHELAIPLTYMLNFNLSVLALAIIARKKINLGGGKFILKSIGKFILISFIISFCIYWVKKSLFSGDLDFLFLGPLGLIIYYYIASALKFNETTLINEKFIQVVTKFKK